jgi:hypothetical protein
MNMTMKVDAITKEPTPYYGFLKWRLWLFREKLWDMSVRFVNEVNGDIADAVVRVNAEEMAAMNAMVGQTGSLSFEFL